MPTGGTHVGVDIWPLHPMFGGFYYRCEVHSSSQPEHQFYSACLQLVADLSRAACDSTHWGIWRSRAPRSVISPKNTNADGPASQPSQQHPLPCLAYVQGNLSSGELPWSREGPGPFWCTASCSVGSTHSTWVSATTASCQVGSRERAELRSCCRPSWNFEFFIIKF